MDKSRYYFDTHGNDDAAYHEAIKFTCELANQDLEVDKIILLAASKSNVDWLVRIYSDTIVKKLFNGVKFSDCRPVFKIETVKTIQDHSQNKDIVITMGLDSEDVFKIDDFWGVKYIISIPWLLENNQLWIKTWGPTEIRSNQNAEIYDLPHAIAQVAFKSLTERINMSTGISHPSDERDAKTYIRALHKYVGIDGSKVFAFLVRELGWFTRHATEIKDLVDKLNAGRSFHGGDKTHLKKHIKRWESEI